MSLIQIRPDCAEDYSVIQWIAFASNAFNVMVPFYTDVETIPEYFSDTVREVSTDSFYWCSRMIAAMTDASYKNSLIHVERYQEKVMALAHENLNKYDALIQKETDPEKRQNLRMEANQRMVESVKEETIATLDKVLYELSNQMKNSYARSDA